MLDCGVSSPDAAGDHLIDADAGVDDGAFRNMRARQQASGLPGVNALTRQRLYVEAIDHIDLLLQRLQRLQRFARASWPRPGLRRSNDPR